MKRTLLFLVICITCAGFSQEAGISKPENLFKWGDKINQKTVSFIIVLIFNRNSHFILNFINRHNHSIMNLC